ncbi:unnamed protein product [Boreogadus saida]
MLPPTGADETRGRHLGGVIRSTHAAFTPKRTKSQFRAGARASSKQEYAEQQPGILFLLLLLLPVDHSKMAAVFLTSQQPMLRLSMPRFHCRVRNGSDRKGAASGLVLGTATEESREWGRNGYGKVRVTPTFGGGNATQPAPLQSDPFRTLQWKCA